MRQLISIKSNLLYYFAQLMGSVIQLKNKINNSYFQLKNSVEDRLMLVEEKIKSKLESNVDLVQKMTN